MRTERRGSLESESASFKKIFREAFPSSIKTIKKRTKNSEAVSNKELRIKIQTKIMGGLLSTLQSNNQIESDAEILNALNLSKSEGDSASDVVVIGGGIHSLIYAIHSKKLEILNNRAPTTITIIEKASSPGYKIGESTLTVFGLWLKLVGIESPMLWRLFGPKDGLAFYYFPESGNPENYTEFTANGPPGDFVPTLQIERKISELMLTLYAQRLGINVLHGHEALIDSEMGKSDEGVTVTVEDLTRKTQSKLHSKLLIDASGRHHRLVSKNCRIEKVDGFNTNAFWAYFDCAGDESEIPLRNYESVNTNHLCIPEGWAWVIRLPSWEGSPLPNLIKMINHLLDLNAAKTPADEYPSVNQLVEMFDVKFRWVVSIGFALRADVVYPDDLHTYGESEAAQKFNWIVGKYPKIAGLMDEHHLIVDLYGPGTTWFVRKNIAFRSPQVTGQNWMAIGDATGFTNPLYSPGINANMSTSIYAAEMTHKYLSNPSPSSKKALFAQYELFCANRIPNLQRMNMFNYVCMRSPALGPLGPLWQYLIGTGNANFQQARKFDLANCAEHLTTWDWGANAKEFIEFAKLACETLAGPPGAVLAPEKIEYVQKLSSKLLKEAMATGKYKGRWSGLLRFYDDDLVFDEKKLKRDVLARRCKKCGEWKMLVSEFRRCAFCGHEHTVDESTKVIYKTHVVKA